MMSTPIIAIAIAILLSLLSLSLVTYYELFIPFSSEPPAPNPSSSINSKYYIRES
jgi:hypothetical protein